MLRNLIILLFLFVCSVGFAQTINGWTNMNGAVIYVQSGMLAVDKSGSGQMGVRKQASAPLAVGMNYEWTAIVDKGTCNSSSIIEARIVNSVGIVIVAEQFTTSGLHNLSTNFTVPVNGNYFMEFERIGNNSNCTFYINKIKLVQKEIITEVCAVPVGDYRYGYQGSEKDDELKGVGNSYTTFYRNLDPRLGRWLSADPISQPWQSPYTSMDNSPMLFNDPKGDKVKVGKKKQEKKETELEVKKSISSTTNIVNEMNKDNTKITYTYYADGVEVSKEEYTKIEEENVKIAEENKEIAKHNQLIDAKIDLLRSEGNYTIDYDPSTGMVTASGGSGGTDATGILYTMLSSDKTYTFKTNKGPMETFNRKGLRSFGVSESALRKGVENLEKSTFQKVIAADIGRQLEGSFKDRLHILFEVEKTDPNPNSRVVTEREFDVEVRSTGVDFRNWLPTKSGRRFDQRQRVYKFYK